PRAKEIVDLTKRELASHGATWKAWDERLVPFQGTVRAKLKTASAKTKGLAGDGGFLFYRNEVETGVGGGVGPPRAGKNPLPIIADFAKALAARGVDFLFVPVPNKVEVLPERLDGKNASLVGAVVNPYARKFLQDLGATGVETIDLLPVFLAERAGD